MNKFLKQHGLNGERVILNKLLDSFLKNRGFEQDSSAYDEKTIGWSTAFYDKEKFYFYRVHITEDAVQIHEEYDFGGLSREWKEPLEKEDLQDVDSFVLKLNQAYEPMNI